jgi:hypothetical protein
MARRYRVVDYIVEHLAGADVDYIFGVDGLQNRRARQLRVPARAGPRLATGVRGRRIARPHYHDEGVRITVGDRVSTRAVLAAIAKSAALTTLAASRPLPQSLPLTLRK